MKIISLMALLFCYFFIGCAANKTVRQSDLNAWKGVSVEELDAHYLFSTIHMVKTVTDSGMEIRDYVNKPGINACDKYGLINGYMAYQDFTVFNNCTSLLAGCDNIFYIRNGKVLKYKPIGACYTDEGGRP